MTGPADPGHRAAARATQPQPSDGAPGAATTRPPGRARCVTRAAAPAGATSTRSHRADPWRSQGREHEARADPRASAHRTEPDHHQADDHGDDEQSTTTQACVPGRSPDTSPGRQRPIGHRRCRSPTSRRHRHQIALAATSAAGTTPRTALTRYHGHPTTARTACPRRVPLPGPRGHGKRARRARRCARAPPGPRPRSARPRATRLPPPRARARGERPSAAGGGMAPRASGYLVVVSSSSSCPRRRTLRESAHRRCSPAARPPTRLSIRGRGRDPRADGTVRGLDRAVLGPRSARRRAAAPEVSRPRARGSMPAASRPPPPQPAATPLPVSPVPPGRPAVRRQRRGQRGRPDRRGRPRRPAPGRARPRAAPPRTAAARWRRTPAAPPSPTSPPPRPAPRRRAARAQVPGRAGDEPGAGDPGVLGRLRDAEVDEHRAALGDQDVARRQVAVQDARGVDGGERVAQPLGEVGELGRRERTVGSDRGRERRARPPAR